MTQSNKNRGKKRSLLDEEELTPKPDAWDFFYGKAPLSGALPSDAPSLGREERAASIIPTEVTSPNKHSLPESSIDPETTPSPAHSVSSEITDGAHFITDSSISNSAVFSEVEAGESAEISPKQNLKVTKQPLAFKTRQPLIGPLPPPAVPTNEINENHLSTQELSFDDFERAFRKRLTKADLKVCKIIFDQTHALGKDNCLMRIDDLVGQIGISKRHLYRVLSELENSGFIERGGIYNTPTKKGIEITFYLVPRLKKSDSARHFHYYDS